MNTRSNEMLDTVSRVLRYACAALALLCIVLAIIAAISTGCSGGCAGSDSTESARSVFSTDIEVTVGKIVVVPCRK